MLKIIIALALVACTEQYAFVTEVTPSAPHPEMLEAWTLEVQEALDIWQAAVGADCTIQISIGRGPAIALMTQAEWDEPQLNAYYERRSGEIHVLGEQPDDRFVYTIVHEFGHAMGLIDHITDQPSIMSPWGGSEIFPADVELMRQSLGCK